MQEGIKLDIGCGDRKLDYTWTGIDYRKLEGVDIVQDLEKFPWNIPNDCASIARCMHVVEHINPCKGTFIKFMDEIWRTMMTGADLYIECPYATSKGYFRDPTHCNPCNEETWEYFDHTKPLYNVYKPKPWSIESLEFDQDTIKVILRKCEPM